MGAHVYVCVGVCTTEFSWYVVVHINEVLSKINQY